MHPKEGLKSKTLAYEENKEGLGLVSSLPVFVQMAQIFFLSHLLSWVPPQQLHYVYQHYILLLSEFFVLLHFVYFKRPVEGVSVLSALESS